MITIQMLAVWFILSAVVFSILNIFFHEDMNRDRSINTYFIILAQGLAAGILSLFN